MSGRARWRRSRWTPWLCGLCLFLLFCCPFRTFPALAEIIETTAKPQPPAVILLDPAAKKPALYHQAQDWVYDLLEVYFLNVGSSDSILLRVGPETMLVDSGLELHHQRITDFLASLGITELTYVFGTHPHNDHIGGFPAIFYEIPVGSYLQPPLFDDVNDSWTRKLTASLKEHLIPVRTVKSGETLSLGNAKLTFYQWQKADAMINNRSMILRVQLGQRSLLLAADVEGVGQKALALQWGQALQADLLKYPHHGLTGLDVTFLQAVSPALVTVSNTQASIPTALRKLRHDRIPYLLTPQGTVVAVTDGYQWQVWQLPKKGE